MPEPSSHDESAHRPIYTGTDIFAGLVIALTSTCFIVLCGIQIIADLAQRRAAGPIAPAEAWSEPVFVGGAVLVSSALAGLGIASGVMKSSRPALIVGVLVFAATGLLSLASIGHALHGHFAVLGASSALCGYCLMRLTGCVGQKPL